jgi:hypothetical protein
MAAPPNFGHDQNFGEGIMRPEFSHGWQENELQRLGELG